MKAAQAQRGATRCRARTTSKSGAATNPRPVRKVVTRSTARVVGYFSSIKMDALIPWESQLELDCLRILEVDNNVIGIHAQPEWVTYACQGRERRYCPDFAVQYRDGSNRRIEVKYEADAVRPEMQERFVAVGSVYSAHRVEFRVMTESEIRREPRLANAKRMLRDLHLVPRSDLSQRVADIFNVRRPQTIRALEEALGYLLECREDLIRMALRGYFDIDIGHAPLGAETSITSDFDHSKLARSIR